ncbi:MAG: hypothetical protein H7338_14360 [Candidatus Sericytochromatia bacterium]|nr:hypothetical protein [Candidatus Sericytochromatia bacterium]
MSNSDYIAMDSLKLLDRWVSLLNTQAAGTAASGYKAERMTFTGGVTQIDTLAGGLTSQLGEAGLHYSSAVDYSQGDISSSISADHMAIRGGGFFAVATSLTAGAAVQYTRDGEFHKDAGGFYRTKEGYYLLSADDVDPQANVVRDPVQFGRPFPSALDPFGPGGMGVTDLNFVGIYSGYWQDPPSAGLGLPMNYAVNMGSVGLAYTATATNPTNNAVWSATTAMAGMDAGYGAVGWYTNDTTADSGNGGGSLHYGQNNVATYATGQNRANKINIAADWTGTGDVDLHITEPGAVVTDKFDVTNNGLYIGATTGTAGGGGANPANSDENYLLNIPTGRADFGTPITAGTYSAIIDGATAATTVTYQIVEDYGTVHQAVVSSGSTAIAPPPINYIVDMGAAGLTDGTTFAAGSWIRSTPKTGPFGSVGWYSNDSTANNFGAAGSMHFGRQNTASYASGVDSAGKLDVVIDWALAGDVDLHVYEPGPEHTYYGDKFNNGILNRDQGTGVTYPGGPLYTDWDEWYTVNTDARGDGLPTPTTPSTNGVYNAQIYGYGGLAANTPVTYQFIEDAGTIHQNIVASGVVSVSNSQTVNLASATLANNTVQGSLFSPEYVINPIIPMTTIAFDHSYALDGTGVETNAAVDIMTFAYQTFDDASATWDAAVTTTIPKPTTAAAFATLSQSVATTGKGKLRFKWDFASVDGKKNAGRGWNLEKLVIDQGPPAAASVAIGSVVVADRRNSGSIYSPSFALNTAMSSANVSFDQNYLMDAFGGLEGNAAVDTMRFGYRLNGGAWSYLPSPKAGASSAGWVNYLQNVLTGGAANIQFRWDFDTVDGKYNAGRGWNMENFKLDQFAPTTSNYFRARVYDLNNGLAPGSTICIYNPVTGVEGVRVGVTEGAFVNVPFGVVADWPIPNGTVRIYDNMGVLADEHLYAPSIQSQGDIDVSLAFRRGLQPAIYDEPKVDLRASDRGISYMSAPVISNVPTFIPWKSVANPNNPGLVRRALEQANSSVHTVAPELAMAKNMYTMLSKIIASRKSNFDLLAGLIR